MQVLDRTLDATRTGYFWAYMTPVRAWLYGLRLPRLAPRATAEMLKGSRGYLQTDAYTSYDSVVSGSSGRIVAVGGPGSRAAGVLRCPV